MRRSVLYPIVRLRLGASLFSAKRLTRMYSLGDSNLDVLCALLAALSVDALRVVAARGPAQGKRGNAEPRWRALFGHAVVALALGKQLVVAVCCSTDTWPSATHSSHNYHAGAVCLCASIPAAAVAVWLQGKVATRWARLRRRQTQVRASCVKCSQSSWRRHMPVHKCDDTCRNQRAKHDCRDAAPQLQSHCCRMTRQSGSPPQQPRLHRATTPPPTQTCRRRSRSSGDWPPATHTCSPSPLHAASPPPLASLSSPITPASASTRRLPPRAAAWRASTASSRGCLRRRAAQRCSPRGAAASSRSSPRASTRACASACLATSCSRCVPWLRSSP